MAGDGRRAFAYVMYSLASQRKFSLEIQHFGLKSPTLGEFRSKIELFGTHYLLCLKFAAVYAGICLLLQVL